LYEDIFIKSHVENLMNIWRFVFKLIIKFVVIEFLLCEKYDML